MEALANEERKRKKRAEDAVSIAMERQIHVWIFPTDSLEIERARVIPAPFGVPPQRAFSIESVYEIL